MLLIITLIICFIAVTALVENFNGTVAFCSLIATLLFLHFVVTPLFEPFWLWTKGNTLTLILGILGYFTIGCLWSFYKWKEYLENKYGSPQGNVYHKPDALEILSANKDKIALWIGYWPTSLFWFCLKNPFTWIGRTLTTKLQHVYISMVTKQLDKLQPKTESQK